MDIGKKIRLVYQEPVAGGPLELPVGPWSLWPVGLGGRGGLLPCQHPWPGGRYVSG